MTRAARYTVLIDRELGESDGITWGYHDGQGRHAAEHLAKELQEAWEAGGVSGFFEVVERRIVDWPDSIDNKLFADEPRLFENEDDDPESPAVLAKRLSQLGLQVSRLKDQLEALSMDHHAARFTEAANAIDDGLDYVDSAIRTLESEDPESDEEEPIAEVVACIAAGSHLVSCDEDGYCNACGHQEGWDDEAQDWLPQYKAVLLALTGENPCPTPGCVYTAGHRERSGLPCRAESGQHLSG